jgi:hypothetical protein
MIVQKLGGVTAITAPIAIGCILLGLAAWAGACTLYYVDRPRVRASLVETIMFWLSLAGIQVLGWMGGLLYLYSSFAVPLTDKITEQAVNSSEFRFMQRFVLGYGVLSAIFVPFCLVTVLMLRKDALCAPLMLLRECRHRIHNDRSGGRDRIDE